MAAMEELRDLSGVERDAYFRGVHPIWGGGLSEDRFVAFQRRLADAGEAGERHRLIGLFDGSRLLAAMKAYDLRGSCAAKPLRILGIGAVFTPPPLRRRGHARRMLELAVADHAARGAQAAILFSDIGTAYYERLGFRALRSEECMVDPSGLPRTGSHAAGPADESGLSRLLARGRASNGDLTLARDGWVLRFQLRRLRELARARGAAEPEWGIAVRDGSGEAAAMVRMARDAIDLLDAGWTSEGARDALLARLREILVRSGRHRLRLWPSHQLRGLFPAQPRSSALAMVAPLRPEVTVSSPGARADLALLDHI
jgi:Acetyltransferase (GNAT) domain